MNRAIVAEIQEIGHTRLKVEVDAAIFTWLDLPWSFLPKVYYPKTATKIKSCTPEKPLRQYHQPSNKRDFLLQCSSLNKIMQFPAFLCTSWFTVYPFLLLLIEASCSALRAFPKKSLSFIRTYSLVFTIYLSLLILALEFAGCCITLCTGNNPPGLIFLITCIFIMGGVAIKFMIRGSHYKSSKEQWKER